jgi:hypothetical protein
MDEWNSKWIFGAMSHFPSFVSCVPNNIGYRVCTVWAAGSLGDRANAAG